MPLYREVLGDAWDRLPQTVRDMHDVKTHMEASGTARVSRAPTIRAHVVCAYMGFPRNAEEVPVVVRFDVDDGIVTWTRTIGDARFSSTLRRRGRGVEERFGPFRFRFLLREREGVLRMVPNGWSVWSVPLPRILQPSGVATERDEAGRFAFDVPIRIPLFGRLIHYSGTLGPPVAVARP